MKTRIDDVKGWNHDLLYCFCSDDGQLMLNTHSICVTGQWVCNICDPDRGNKKGKKYLELAEKYKKKYGKNGPPKTPSQEKTAKET